MQNKNPYGKMEGAEEFKLMNLPLEKLECVGLRNDTLEKKYSKYLKDFTKQEFENEFLLGEDHIEEVFGYLATFIEDALMSRSPLLYA